MPSRARAVAVLVTAVLALLVGQALTTAGAQVPPPPTLPTSTTTTTGGGSGTTSPPSSTTTTGLLPPAEESTTTTTAPVDGTTTTTAPPPGGSDVPLPGGPSTTSTTLVPPGPSDGGGGGGDAVDPAVPPAGPTSPLVPPEAQAIINSVRRTGSNNTKALLEALRPLEAFGFNAQEIAIIGMGRFPVAGYASYSHDWLYPRFVPSFHFHQGTDIFAAYGTPVRSPARGVVSKIGNGAIGGLSVYVTEEDGTYWYMAHLAGIRAGLQVGQSVNIGDVVGFVGDSGNARGGAPHVHFEIHPQGGGPIDPKAILDRFIADATANVPRLIAHFQARQPRALVATGLVRQLSDDSLASAVEQSNGPSRTQLLWASSANPTGGALHLAEAEAAKVAGRVNWEQRAFEEQQRVAAWQAATTLADQLLAPLSVPAVATALASLSGQS